MVKTMYKNKHPKIAYVIAGSLWLIISLSIFFIGYHFYELKSYLWVICDFLDCIAIIAVYNTYRLYNRDYYGQN